MRHYIALGSTIALLVAPSYAAVGYKLSSSGTPGCGKPLPDGIPKGDSINQTIESTSGFTPRKYRINVPDSYDSKKSVPLIFSFHGRTKDMLNQDKLARFTDEKYGFEGITVYPEGVPDKDSGSNQWQGDISAPDSINDVAFTLELLDHLGKNYCIDPKRVYASGKSNGGGFTGILACDPKATTKIAAFAAVSGAFYLDSDGQPPQCNFSSTRDGIPVMEMHGLQDGTMNYTGGSQKRGGTWNIPAWVDEWAKRNNFDPNANKTSHLCSEKKLVTKYNWNDVVVHYKYRNIKHAWPATEATVDGKRTTCEEADATKIILDWFSTKSLSFTNA